jgi:hypothetical protein
LANEDARRKQVAARALAHWGIYGDSERQNIISEAGGIPALVAVVVDGSAKGRNDAANALAALADENTNQRAIQGAGGIPARVARVVGGSAKGQERAANALAALGLVFRSQPTRHLIS